MIDTRPIQPNTNRLLHKLLTERGIMEHKPELVSGFTEGRTAHSSQMLECEARQLIAFLRQRANNKPAPTAPPRDAADRMRKKALAICHTLGWYMRDADGHLLLRNGKPQLDWQRIDGFCRERTRFKKPLQQLSAAELPSVITSFERLLKHDLTHEKNQL